MWRRGEPLIDNGVIEVFGYMYGSVYFWMIRLQTWCSCLQQTARFWFPLQFTDSVLWSPYNTVYPKKVLRTRMESKRNSSTACQIFHHAKQCGLFFFLCIYLSINAQPAIRVCCQKVQIHAYFHVHVHFSYVFIKGANTFWTVLCEIDLPCFLRWVFIQVSH